MPKSFKFYGGPPADQGALAGLFAQSVQAAQAAGATRVQATQQAIQTALGGFQSGIDRRDRRRESAEQKKHDKQQREDYFAFQRKMAEDARGATDARDERQTEESRRAAELEAVRRFGEAGIREQGLPAGAVTQGYLDLSGGGGPPPGQQPGPGLRALGGMAGAAGGAMAGAATPVGFQQQQQGNPFAGIEPLPQRPSWDERRFQFTQEEKDRTATAAHHIATLKAHKDKDLFLERKRTVADGLGLGDHDDFELLEAVLGAYPDLAKRDTDGKLIKQAAVDAKIRFLQKERTELTPWGPGFQDKDWDFVDRDPSIISAAITEVLGDRYYERIPYTDESADAWADERILKRFPEYVNRFRHTQSTRQEQAPQFQEEARGPMQPAEWTDAFIKSFGGTPDQMPLELRSANTFGMRIVPMGDSMIQLERADGTPMEPAYQGALQKLLDGPLGPNLRKKLRIGAEVSTTVSEIRKLSEPQGATNRPASRSQGSAGASPDVRGGGARQATPKRDRSALERLIAIWDAEDNPPVQGPPRAPAFQGAGNIGAFGRTPSKQDALSLLLQSGGL